MSNSTESNNLLASIIDQTVRLVSLARVVHLELRILGSVGVALYVPGAEKKRPARIKDIDLITRSRCRREAQDFLSSNGWFIASELLMFAELREIYRNEEKGLTLDLYYDKLEGSHTIDLRSRLEASFPAVSLTDLILTKLQRQRLRRVDEWDSCELLSVSDGQLEDAYLGSIIARDWGLYRTIADNLEMLGPKCTAATRRIFSLLELMRRSKKSWRWYARAVVGRRMKWWQEVYDTKIPAEVPTRR